MLNPNIIIPFDGNNASIPDGFTRDTRFDGKYVKASSSNIGNTGGNATHSHTSSSHSHSYSTNGHTHNTGTIGGSGTPHKTNARHQDAPPVEVSVTSHTHPGGNSGGMVSASITSETASIGNANNEYSRYHFIFIKSGGYNFIPTGGIVLKNDTNNRDNATHFDNSNGRYLKGASAGADAGSPTDVSTHNHSQSHSHTTNHDHGNISSGAGGGNLGGKNIPSSSMGNHSHTVYFAAKNLAVSNSANISSHTNDLAYKELHLWKLNQASVPQPGDIAILIDGDVPPGWEDLGFDDVYVRGKASGQSLSTGGSLTHSHSDLAHSHSGASHTHNYSTNSVGGSNVYRDGGNSDIIANHSHSSTTGSGTNASTGSNNVSVSTDNYEPEYINVRFVEFQYSIGGGVLMALL